MKNIISTSKGTNEIKIKIVSNELINFSDGIGYYNFPTAPSGYTYASMAISQFVEASSTVITGTQVSDCKATIKAKKLDNTNYTGLPAINIIAFLVKL